MRLTAIELENFKGIGPRQRIELKPITLLFGPNSAGKSTILQALHYVREILERKNVDPDVTIAGGLLDLGGFRSLVHQHDLSRPVRVKLEIEVSPFVSMEDLPLNSEGFTSADGDFSQLPIRYYSMEYGGNPVPPGVVYQIGLELEVRWSEQRGGAYVSRWATELNCEHLAAIISAPEEGRAMLTEFNFAHRLLLPTEADGDSADTSPVQALVRELSREVGLDESLLPESPVETRVAVKTVLAALPDLNRELTFDFRDPEVRKFELEDKTPRIRALSALLSELLLGPARVIRRFLSRMTYIGPLRTVPGRDYIPQFSPDEARWAHGLAAWDLMHARDGSELINKINYWLLDTERLNTGYQIEHLEYRTILTPGPMDAIFQRGIREEDLADLQEFYEQSPIEKKVLLRDTRTGALVGPSDVGVGLSQLIPVIVAVVSNDGGLVAVEQPELHIHPAVQVGLGDLFAASVADSSGGFESERCLLVETHSEHIMLRLLRRIRETNDGELPPGAPSLSPDYVAVIYAEPTEDKLKFTPLRIAADGDFIDRWPRGFFEERGEELF
jgi:energy-coupling factor transporter ATP-binding protein EcfA2